MPVAVGQKSFVAFVTETTYGTDPGSGYKYHRIVSHDFRPNAEPTRGNRGLGRLMRSGIQNKLKRNEGGIVFDPQYEGLELMFLHYCGGTDNFTINSPVTGAHTHKFNPSATRKVGLSVHVNEDISMAKIVGVKTTSMRWAMANENLEVSFGLVGKQHTQVAVDTPTYPTAPDVLALDTASPAGTSVEVDDVADTTITEATVDFAFPHQTNREFLGSDQMQEPIPSDVITATGTLRREYTDTARVADWISNVARKLEFIYQSNTYVTGTTRYKLALTVYKVIFQRARPSIGAGGVVLEEIPFTAMIDGSGNAFEIEAINSIGSAVS